jgi:hypothetical protein
MNRQAIAVAAPIHNQPSGARRGNVPLPHRDDDRYGIAFSDQFAQDGGLVLVVLQSIDKFQSREWLPKVRIDGDGTLPTACDDAKHQGIVSRTTFGHGFEDILVRRRERNLKAALRNLRRN